MYLNPTLNGKKKQMDKIKAKRLITSRRRKRLKVLLENARESIEADFKSEE